VSFTGAFIWDKPKGEEDVMLQEKTGPVKSS